MKIKTLLLTTALCVSTAAFAGPSASAKKHSSNMFKDFYAKVEAGLSMPSKLKAGDNKFKFDKGFVGAIGGGYKFNEFFRTDLMLQYRQPKSKKITQDKDSYRTLKVRNFAAMLNGYLDAHNETIFTPYVMAGFGIGSNKAKVSGKQNGKEIKRKAKNKTNLIWNAGFGCQARVYENISLDLGYRYVDLGKIVKKSQEAGIKKRLGTHEVLLGLTYDL